jgi:hypothetical protein
MSVDVQMEESDNIVVSILYITLNLLDPGRVNGNMPKLTIIRKSGQKADKNN